MMDSGRIYSRGVDLHLDGLRSLSELRHQRMLCAEVLLKKLATSLNQIKGIFKSIKLFTDLSLDEERLNLNVQLLNELVLGFLRRHRLKVLWLLLDLGQGLDCVLGGLTCFFSHFNGL